MSSKLLVFVGLLACAYAAPQHQAAAQYPAGVNPADCPGFPICDNARLHNPQAHWGAPAAPAWQPQPAWQQPQQSWQQPQQSWDQTGQWNAAAHAWKPEPAWQPEPAWNAHGHGPAAPGAADKYPAGVNPHACPNYPFCDVNAGGHGPVAAPPLPGWSERQYPAGVSAHECPNFPYCH